MDLFKKIIKYLTLIFGALACVVPVIVCVTTSLKSKEEYAATNVMELPKKLLNFTNYSEAWKTANMALAFLNTLIILFFVLAGSILTGTMISYVLNRFDFKGKTLLKNLFLFATLIPGIAMQVTIYDIMVKTNLLNTRIGYILLMTGTDVVAIYIFLQFFESIPVSLDESAIVDGANYFTVFFKILLPLLKPAIITVLILKGVSTYNEYFCASLYLQNKDKLVVVATSLYKFSGPMGNQYNYICAGVIITLLPLLILFILLQKHIYSGLTAGAVKG